MGFLIDFEPIGRRVVVEKDSNLLTAAQEAGVALIAVCGGVGVCQGCKVRCVDGRLSEVQSVERETFTGEELDLGWRLACQAFPLSDLKVEVPPESMTVTQRLQTEGSYRKVALEPAVEKIDFSLTPPSLSDLRADWERLTEAIRAGVNHHPEIDLAVVSQFSNRMRELNWQGQAILGKDQRVIGFLPADQPYYGVAVDIGTTKMAAFLIDLTNGKTISRQGGMNPQIAYGEDVISRIAYANQGAPFQKTLQDCLVDSLNPLIREMCASAGVEVTQLVDFVIVGNTAIHHLLTGLPVRQLGQAPYVPAVRQAIYFPAQEIGLFGAPGALVYMPPNIAGYVGADHSAMVLASELESQPGLALALDIGTNTESSLSKGDHLVSCSCASGPAFEGAHIHAGMRAVPGAIERAQFFQGEWHCSTIEGEPPVGICGSGILDVVAALLTSRQIDSAGRFTDNAKRRIDFDSGGAIVLVPAALTGTGKDILVTRSDIREIQLAKAAIRAGIDALLRATNTQPEQIDHFIIAGAFGTYLNPTSAVQIGMFPKLPHDRYQQIGNAAGAGAQQMLVSLESRKEAEAILERMTYIELTTDTGFMDAYVDSIGFDRQD